VNEIRCLKDVHLNSIVIVVRNKSAGFMVMLGSLSVNWCVSSINFETSAKRCWITLAQYSTRLYIKFPEYTVPGFCHSEHGYLSGRLSGFSLEILREKKEVDLKAQNLQISPFQNRLATDNQNWVLDLKLPLHFSAGTIFWGQEWHASSSKRGI
jgi:hypothetical protein